MTGQSLATEWAFPMSGRETDEPEGLIMAFPPPRFLAPCALLAAGAIVLAAGPADASLQSARRPVAAPASRPYRRGVVPTVTGQAGATAGSDSRRPAPRAVIGPVLRYGGGVGGIGVTTGHPKVYLV